MKTFDWEFAEKNSSKEKTAFLSTVRDSKMSEQEFLDAAAKFRLTSNNKRTFNPSKLRREYRNLVEQFGFFQ